MDINPITLDDIKQMTLKVGEEWAINHAKRLIELIRQISVDIPYDTYVIEMATYLHDWGACPIYIQKGVEHAIRSRQVVEVEIAPHLDLTAARKTTLLETIELHDYRDLRPTQSNEALLLREADMLEFLGMIGMARDFARGPRNVEVCYKRILGRRVEIEGRFTTPRAQELARIRLEHMDQCQHWLEGESFGIL